MWSDEALAWAFAADGDAGEIVVLELDGQATQIVAAGGHHPHGYPGGDRLSWVEGEVESPEGWRVHVTDADGTNDVELTGLLPLMQEQPPWPGTNAKRSWLDDGDRLLFSVVGPDYGRAERSGNFRGEAGSDIENYWLVDADGATAPRRATDLTKVFYLQDARESPAGDALAFIGFSYLSRTPASVDGVRPGRQAGAGGCRGALVHLAALIQTARVRPKGAGAPRIVERRN